ncbi:hypothetical protein JDV02_005864 [Purpureocillium takamizusanense]|uniref:Uncharacterized protein n=1 Tax=Purpureocillium takamizusanense TaxID=2060973 RepID=A0A9Q8QHB1_9HYPO|nr:uncharacterized protein JDV02_005864 [Purpureocillium takamizusanense]UNI19693.1 hypothetical protein JDV02_005864 [Purpureocillium takamizusanense]
MSHPGTDATAADSGLGHEVQPTRCAASTRPSAPDLQPWTATRCHRLLRQLQSRLARLRKLAPDEGPASCQESKRSSQADAKSATAKRVKLTYAGRKRHEDTGTEDSKPLVALCTPKRPVRTLGAMKMIKSSPASGQVDIPSPIWRRISDPTDTPRRAQSNQVDISEFISSAPAGTVLSDVTADLRPLAAALGAEKYRIYHAILGWLNTLLLSTVPRGREPAPNSLLAMCLRKIPCCVADIECYERDVAKQQGRQSMWDASNVSFELYGQLETLGSATGGWRPLKLAIRAHGLSLLCQAVAEEVFDPIYVALLIRLCARLGCTEGVHKLATSSKVILPEPRTMLSGLAEDKHLLPLRELVGFDAKRAICRAAMASVSSLAQKDRLPTRWLSTRVFSGLWASNLELISSTTSGAAAMAFSTACLPLMILDNDSAAEGQPMEAEQRLASVVAGMVATLLALSEASHDDPRASRHQRAERRVRYLLDCCFHQVCRRKRGRVGRDSGAFMLVLARYIVFATGPQASSIFAQEARRDLVSLAATPKSVEGSQSRYRQTILLLCSIAQYRGRSRAISSRDCVADISRQLSELNLGDSFDHDLQKDVAFLLAQRTKDLRDLAFAERLKGARNPSGGNAMFSGWRWEEGISEWVLPDSDEDQVEEKPREALRQLRNRSCSNSQSTRASAPMEMSTSRRKRRSDGGARYALCAGKENGGDDMDLPGASLYGDESAPVAKRLRTRPARSGLLRLLPSEDDWDDLL